MFVIISVLPGKVISQTDVNEHVYNYIEKFKEIAMNQMMIYGVPASITLAQGLLESGSGKSDLALQANNHFGIKCKSEGTVKGIAILENGKNEYYRKYSSAEESYKDHSQFIITRPRYFFLFDLNPTDYVSWAKGLKKAGYATNPNYHNLLIGLIKKYKLYVYDKLVLSQSINYQNDL
ncbi:MAG: glucosaminidase domain-containing protein [Bacteroidota bacterium]|nr:glucosaminidase domain-containing protein [Bacteroidota bacterium]